MKQVTGDRRFQLAVFGTITVLILTGLGAGIYSLARGTTTNTGGKTSGTAQRTSGLSPEASGEGLIPGETVIFQRGSGPTALMIGERLVVTIPANSTGGTIGAGRTSKCKLRGDFDLQVTYEVLDYPPSNGVKIGIRAEDLGSVERVSLGDPRYDFPNSPREVYLTNFLDGIQGFAETHDSTAVLRLKREGTMVSGYVSRDGTWQLVHTGAATTAVDVPVTILAWSEDSAFSHREVRIAFSSFKISQGQFTCS